MAIDDQKTLEEQMLQIQQDQVKRSMGVGAPGTPTSVTPPPFRGAGAVGQFEGKSRFPALKTESNLGFDRPVFEKETKPLDLGLGLFSRDISLGIDLPTDVKVTIADPAKITPALRIQQVMNFDNPKIVTGFEKSLGVRNKNGKELYFREDQGYAERLDAANRFGATSIIKEDGNLFKIPWENKIYDMTRLQDPDQMLRYDVDTGEVELGPTGRPQRQVVTEQIKAGDVTREEFERIRDAKMLGSLNFTDPEVAKPMFADFLNNKLIQGGIEDARTRADLINASITTFSMDDHRKIASSIGENTIRFTASMGLWGFGETADAAIKIINELGIKFGNLDEIPEEDMGWADIRQSDRRDAIMEQIWIPFSHMLIAEAAQRGVEISLADAETYISTLTGLVPRIAKLTGEFALPSRMAASVSKKLAVDSRADFMQYFLQKTGQRYYNKDTRKYEIKDVSPDEQRQFDDILDEYVQIKAGRVLDEATGTFTDAPSWLTKIKAGTIENRIRRGTQIADSKLTAQSRKEVMDATTYLDNTIRRRDAYAAGIQKRRSAGRTITEADSAKLRSLTATVDAAVRAKRKAELYSSTPKFMRDIGVTDTYMIMGAATVGHFFQQNTDTEGVTGDAMMGELFGLGAGIALSLTAGSVPAALNFIKKKNFLFYGSGTKKGYTAWLAKNISTLAPELQQQITMRAQAIDDIHTTLVAEGLDPGLLDLGFAEISGLVTLKSLEDMVRSKLSTGQIQNFDVGHLQEIMQYQKELVANLRQVASGLGSGIGGTPKGDFRKIIDMAIQQGQESVENLSKDLKIINKRGVEYYLDITRGNTMAHQKGQTNDGFEKALDRLDEDNLVDADSLPRVTFNQQVDDAHTRIHEELGQKADYTRSELANISQTKVAVTAATGPTIKAAGQSEEVTIASLEKTGDLLAALSESRHAAEKAKAKRPYAILDRGQFVDVDADGNILGAVPGNPTVNVGTIFDQIFVGVEDLPSAKLRGATVTSGEMANFDETVQILSEPYFTSLAEGSDQSVKEVIDAMVLAAQDDGLKIVKGLSKQTQLVRWLRKTAAEANSELDAGLEMTFSQLREFDKSIRHLANKSYARGDNTRGKIYTNIENAIQTKFDQFEVVNQNGDRVSINDLSVMTVNDVGEDVPVSVRQLLAEGNAGWAKFKSNWYDQNERAIMPKWMSWGDRTSGPVTRDQPLGIRYGRSPDTWFDVKKIGAMDPQVEGFEFYKSLRRTLGREAVNTDGSIEYAFVEGESTTIALEKIVKTAIADYVISNRINMSPDQLAKVATNMNATFTMKGADGKIKPLLDIESVIDDAIGYSRKSVGDEAYEAANATARNNIESAIEKAIEPAEKALREKQLAIRVLERFTGQKLKDDQIADALVSGGALELEKLRTQLKSASKGKFSDEQIDKILADIYVDSMEQRVFYNTGRSIQTAEGDSIGRELINVDEIERMLGVNDKEKAPIIRKLIGERRYRVWQAMSDLMTSRENHYKKSDFEVTGVPRSFAMESYISRLYALNRGVISTKYVVAEATLMAFRSRRFRTASEILKDPVLGEMFIEMVRSGKPFTPNRNQSDQFISALTVAFAKTANQIGNPEPKTMYDQYGREFKISRDVNSSNIIRTGRDVSFDIEALKEISAKRGFNNVQEFIEKENITRMEDGRYYGVPIPQFPEIQKAQQQNFATESGPLTGAPFLKSPLGTAQ